MGMTREEAIKNIKEHCYFASLLPQAKEALDEAIKALEQEPCEDAISRMKVIDTIYHECSAENLDIDFAKVILLQRNIKALPSVNPQLHDAEIQKIQELEQAEIQKAYELGKEDKIKILDKIRAEIEQAADKLWICVRKNGG